MCLFLGATAQKDLRGLGTRSSSEAKGKAETENKNGGCISYTRDMRTHVKRTHVSTYTPHFCLPAREQKTLSHLYTLVSVS